MKKYYFRFRTFLITLTLGLAFVFFIEGSLQDNKVKVNLPIVKNETSTFFFSLSDKHSKLYIISIEKEIDPTENAAGASGGITCDEARKSLENKNTQIPNCDK